MFHGFIHVGNNGFAAVEGDQKQQRLMGCNGSVYVGGGGIFQKGHRGASFSLENISSEIFNSKC